MHKYFLTTYRQTEGKIHRKLSILQKSDLYLNQFSNKKGAIGKPEWPKKHPIWAAHPRTHLSTKYPPRIFSQNFCSFINFWHLFEGVFAQIYALLQDFSGFLNNSL